MKNKKSLGQHWLKNREILETVAELAKVPGVATCLEIGPGLGTLTASLLRRFDQVIAIELDENLAKNLPRSFPGKNLKVVQADFLQVNLGELFTADTTFVVAGNIPYYITSPIIRKLLESSPCPTKIVLLIQKEVAERIAAGPGRASLLSLMVQNHAEVVLGPVVPAAEFTPPPKVDSQVLVLTPLHHPQVSAAALNLAKIGFSSPRKKLIANLATGGEHSKNEWREILQQNHLSPDVRAEDLALSDWENLTKVL